MKLEFYKKGSQGKTPVILASILILVISYFTYFHNYASPQGIFWDENYHIPAAQKYLHQIFFMYDHPPLGPMLVALGERLLQANKSSDQFINIYYAKDFASDFSFAGYRLVPVICAWLLPLIFFYIALNLVNNTIIAFLLSFLCLFENAMIVHFRGAMLDAPLIGSLGMTVYNVN